MRNAAVYERGPMSPPSWWRINVAGAACLAALACSSSGTDAEGPGRPNYQPVRRSQGLHESRPSEPKDLACEGPDANPNGVLGTWYLARDGARFTLQVPAQGEP